jgi:hypothetical protein
MNLRCFDLYLISTVSEDDAHRGNMAERGARCLFGSL